MKRLVQAAIWLTPWCATSRLLVALALLADLAAAPRAQAQPTVLGTDAYNGNYATYNLTSVGGFRQYRGQATVSALDNAYQWEFVQGTAASPDYSQKWRPFTTPNNTRYRIAGFNQFIAPNRAATPVSGTATYVGSGGVPGGLPAVTAGNYYTFNITTNAPSSDNNLAVLETTYLPVTIGAPTNTATGYGQPTTVTATLGGTPNAAENFYLRYTTNNFASTTVQPMTKSGNTVSYTIPAQTSVTVTYYIFSSNETASQLATDFTTYGEPVYDMASLNVSSSATYTSVTLNGIYTINQTGSGSANFTTFGAAFSALVTGGVSGPVTFQVKDGQTFTESNLTLAAVGGASSTNRITFQRDNSAAAAPVVQASTAVTPGQQDAIIKLQGADFITFDAINVTENISNNDLGPGNNAAMEYGYALFRNNSTDGCQNNIIRNCTITLNRANGNPTYGIWVANTNLMGATVSASNNAGTNSNNTLANNVIGNCRFGIDVAGEGTLDAGNVLGGTTGLAPGNTISVVTNFGILAYNQAGLIVGGNTISFPTGNTGFMYGIVVGENTAGALVTGNRVRTINYTGTGGVGVRGISIDPGVGAANITVVNNAVSDLTSDGNGNSNVTQIMGIGLLSGTGYNVYNNSVQLNGERPANANLNKVAAALYVGNSVSGIDLRNNVLSNVQSTNNLVQTGTNYGVYVEGTANPFTTIDYNLYDLRSGAATRVTAISPQYLGRLNGTDYATLAAWKAATGQDRSSMLSSGANTTGFTSSINLLPSASDASSYVLNGTGVQLASVTTDITGAARPITVTAGAPDLGAYEFTPTVAPNPLDASGPSGPGLTQTFAVNGRPIAAITYGTGGTVPTSVVARYYPGTNPPTPYVANARYANAYFTFNDNSNNGSAYTYTLTTYYDPALLGTISSETQQRLSPQNATATGYTTVSTTVNTTARTLTSPGTLNSLGLVAISDVAAPLPVSLTSFTAVRQNADALLSWTTASEQDNAGFEVQVSLTGNAADFRPLGFVAAASPSSLTARSYTFRDQEAGKTGLRYYRLRQLDLAGTAAFSSVRSVAFAAPTTAQVTAWPTPFATQLTLNVALPQAVASASLTLLDVLGRPVLHQELGALPAGASQPTLGAAALAQLPADVYVLRVALPGGTQSLKVVKE